MMGSACFVLFYRAGRNVAQLRMSPILREPLFKLKQPLNASTISNQVFADMPIGAIIFDDRGQLRSFNPSFTALFGIDPEWLLASPTLRAVFDKMLVGHGLPVMRDISEWIDGITSIQNIRAHEFWHDQWTLPDGRTIYVIAKPFPKNRLCLYFEDRTENIRQTHDLLAEIGMMHSVNDQMVQGVALFDSGGALAYHNPALASIWNQDFSGLEAQSFINIVQTWRDASLPNPFWGDLRDFENYGEDRAGWSTDLELKNGKKLDVAVSPLPHGALMCEFWEK
ncbi:MAG: PAS-domain containing protein [Pseudomonadota bacterium]